MKNSKQSKLQRFWQRLGPLRVLGLLVTLLLGILLILPALTQPVTLSLLMHVPEATQWRSLIQAFEAKNPGIRINLVEAPNDTNLEEDLYTSAFLLGSSPYDLVYMDIVWAPKFAAAGWLTDLTNRVSPAELAAFIPADVEGGRYEGGLYRIPFRSDVGMLYYRKDLLQQAGYKSPETFADLMQASQTLQDQGATRFGYVWQGRQYEGAVAMFVEVLKGYGGFWIDPQTQAVGLDQPAAVEAVKFLRSTIEQGVSPPSVTTYNEDEALRPFQSGEAVFMRSWPFAWPQVNGPDSPIRGKVDIQPMVHAQGFDSGACQGGWGLGISKTTRHPEEAWRAIQFFTSELAQRQFVLENAYVPSRRALFTDPEVVQKYSYYPRLLEVVDNAVLRAPIAQYAQASDILQRYLSVALTGRQSPQKAMRAAAKETRTLLGDIQTAAQKGALAG